MCTVKDLDHQLYLLVEQALNDYLPKVLINLIKDYHCYEYQFFNSCNNGYDANDNRNIDNDQVSVFIAQGINKWVEFINLHQFVKSRALIRLNALNFFNDYVSFYFKGGFRHFNKYNPQQIINERSNEAILGVLAKKLYKRCDKNKILCYDLDDNKLVNEFEIPHFLYFTDRLGGKDKILYMFINRNQKKCIGLINKNGLYCQPRTCDQLFGYMFVDFIGDSVLLINSGDIKNPFAILKINEARLEINILNWKIAPEIIRDPLRYKYDLTSGYLYFWNQLNLDVYYCRPFNVNGNFVEELKWKSCEEML